MCVSLPADDLGLPGILPVVGPTPLRPALEHPAHVALVPGRRKVHEQVTDATPRLQHGTHVHVAADKGAITGVRVDRLLRCDTRERTVEERQPPDEIGLGPLDEARRAVQGQLSREAKDVLKLSGHAKDAKRRAGCHNKLALPVFRHGRLERDPVALSHMQLAHGLARRTVPGHGVDGKQRAVA